MEIHTQNLNGLSMEVGGCQSLLAAVLIEQLDLDHYRQGRDSLTGFHSVKLPDPHEGSNQLTMRRASTTAQVVESTVFASKQKQFLDA